MRTISQTIDSYFINEAADEGRRFDDDIARKRKALFRGWFDLELDRTSEQASNPSIRFASARQDRRRRSIKDERTSPLMIHEILIGIRTDARSRPTNENFEFSRGLASSTCRPSFSRATEETHRHRSIRERLHFNLA